MNITANEDGNPEAVLIRDVYPVGGADAMYESYLAKGRRKTTVPKPFESLSDKEVFSLTNGPGKLCISMQIDRTLDTWNMAFENSVNHDGSAHGFFVRDDGYRVPEIVRSPRIGIDYAGEAAAYPWRFTVKTQNGVPFFTK